MREQTKALLLLTLMVLSLAAILPMGNSGNTWTAIPRQSTITGGLTVNNPKNANDSNQVTYADFRYGQVASGAFVLRDFSVPTKVAGNLPSILSVNLTMRYYTAADTAATPDDQYRIAYYVNYTSPGTSQVLVDWRTDFTKLLDVNAFDDTKAGWNRNGTTPYLGSIDTNMIRSDTKLLPLNNGFYTAWTGDYTAWDEWNTVLGQPTHDGDTTYISTTLSNQNETSTLKAAPASTSGPVGTVRMNIVARQTNTTAGNENVRLMLRIGTKAYNGSLVRPTSTYDYYSSDWAVNPATGLAWTWSDISTLQAGVRSQVNGTWANNNEMRITQMFIETIPGDTIGDFDFSNLATDISGGKVFLDVYAKGDYDAAGFVDDSIEAYVWDGTSWSVVDMPTKAPTFSWGWLTSYDIGDILNTKAKIDAAKAYLVKKSLGSSGTIYVNAMRLKVYNVGFPDAVSNKVWTLTEPNDGSWNFTDVTKLRFAVETKQNGGSQDTGCNFYEYEVWADLILPNAKMKVRPSSKVDTSVVPPTSTITLRPSRDTATLLHSGWFNYNATAYPNFYKSIDEAVLDTSDYIYTNLASKFWAFQLPDQSPQSWGIARLRFNVVAKYDVATDEQLQLNLLNGTTAYPARMGKGAPIDKFTLTTSWATYYYDWGVNPSTQKPWSWADINALEVELVSVQGGTGWTGQIQVAQLWVEVTGPRQVVEVGAEDMANDWGFSFLLSFDTTWLDIIGYGIPEALYTDMYPSSINDPAGYISLSYAMVAGTTEGLSGNRTLAILVFMPTGTGWTGMELSDTKLTKPDASLIAHDVYSGYFSNVGYRDVSTEAITPYGTRGFNGTSYGRDINVTVKNWGAFTETFKVTLYWNSSNLIGESTVAGLAPGASKIVTIEWYIVVPNYGTCYFSAVAEHIAYDNNAANNDRTQGSMVVTVKGDANGDKIVNSLDVGSLNSHWSPAGGAPPWSLGYSPDFDVNGDGYINSLDIGTVNANWGKTW